MHSAEKACDTTLDDEKYEVHRDRECQIGKHMTDGTQETRVMTAVCNQLEALLWTSVTTSHITCIEENFELSVFVTLVLKILFTTDEIKTL